MTDSYITPEGTEREYLEDMEKEIYVDNLTIDYDGLFSYKDLLKLINDWTRSNKYYKEITNSKEKVVEKGKNISVDFQMKRKIAHEYLCLMEMSFDIKGMTDVDMEVDGNMKNLNSAKITISFHSFLASSIRSTWETKSFVAFIRGVINKFIYKIDRPSTVGLVVQETKNLAFNIRGFLNSYPSRIEGETNKVVMNEGRKPELEMAQQAQSK